MKKTVEEIMDENPDLTPEEASNYYVGQDVPEAPSPAPMQAKSLEKAANTALPSSTPAQTGNVMDFGGMDITAEKPAVNSTAPAPYDPPPPPPTKPDINEDLVKYRERMGTDATAVRGLFGERADKEDAITKDIEAEEDNIRKIRGESGTESALYAGGEVLAGTLGKMLKYDASPQVDGFKSAQKSLAARPDEARQRREFLQQRLYRADDKTKRAGEELQFGKAMRGERQAELIDEDTTQSEQTKARNNTARNKLDSVKIGEEGKNYDPQSTKSMSAARIAKSQLKRVADEGGSMAAVAQEAYDNFDSTDPLKPGLIQEPMLSRNELIADIIKANKENRRFSLSNLSVGDTVGFGILDENKGKFVEKEMGYKTPASTGRAALQDDKDVKELGKRAGDIEKNRQSMILIENMVGNLDDPNTVSDKNKKIPGIYIPGLGKKPNPLDTKSREFEAAVKNYTAGIIHTDYGASQTAAELKVAAQRFEQTVFGSNAERLRALARMKEQERQVLKQIRASFKDTVTGKYDENKVREGLNPGAQSTSPGQSKSWRDAVGGK